LLPFVHDMSGMLQAFMAKGNLDTTALYALP